MNRIDTARLLALACTGLAAGTAAAPSLAQDAATHAEAPAIVDRAYRRHVLETVTDPDWKAIEDRGYRAQQARPLAYPDAPVRLTNEEQLMLDRQGRAAQRAHGVRLPTSAQPAQQARPGHVTHQPVNLTVNEQRELNRRGWAAQQARGNRLASSPVTTPSPPRTARMTPLRPTMTSPVRPAAGNRLGSAANTALKVDVAAQAFGGRDLGVGRLGTDLTEGQLRNALRGGDPIALGGRSVRRFGRDLASGLTGIGQSVTDPRRIPGNVSKAATGVARSAVGTAQWGIERAVRTGRDAGRVLTDPKFAEKQVKKAGRTAQNVGQSLCKGLSYFIPGGDRKKCR